MKHCLNNQKKTLKDKISQNSVLVEGKVEGNINFDLFTICRTIYFALDA